MSNIAVTGIGGGVGQSIIKSLYNTGYNVIGLDGDLLGAGLYALPRSYIIPYASRPRYIPALLEICRNEKIELFFPGLDAELMPLALNRDAFKAIGTTVVVSSPEVITISDNKQETFDKLSAFGVNVPWTMPLENYKGESNTGPVIVKQKVGGARSKNVFIAKTTGELDAVRSTIGDNTADFIIQQYIEGDEYTCGTINLNNTCRGVIVMRRILRDGDTYKCFTEKNPVIEEEVRKIVEAIKPFGACNIQLRLMDGKPYVFEINARCSGTTAARTACGFNEPKMIADYLLKGIEPAFEIQEKTILRYWNELVVDNSLVAQIKDNNQIELPNYTRL